MRERQVMMNWFFSGTLSGDAVRSFSYHEPFTLLKIGGTAENDSSATLAASGGATIAAAAIGDSGAFVYAAPTSSQMVAAGTEVILTLDYDGASGTASANVEAQVILLTGG